MLRRSLFFALVAIPLIAPAARAQFWDAPSFFSPGPMDDIGLYYFHTDKGDVNGLKGIWRQSGNINLGVQLGAGNIKDFGNAILVGAEFYNSLGALSSNTGLRASWSLGAGATFGDGYLRLAVPFGISMGPRLGTGSTTLLPYVHPRISLDLLADDDAAGVEHTDTELGWAVDFGAELGLGQRLLLRAGYTAGNNERKAFGAGLAYRIPRPVLVR